MINSINKESKIDGYQAASQKEQPKEITPETGPALLDHLPERQEKTIEDLNLALKSGAESQPEPISSVKNAQTANGGKQWPYYQEVEEILEDNLDEVYNQLTPAKKQEFKIKGEEAVREITQLLNSAKVKMKQIFTLIISWLKVIPGVNKFFLVQEAKIKSDKILALRKKQ